MTEIYSEGRRVEPYGAFTAPSQDGRQNVEQTKRSNPLWDLASTIQVGQLPAHDPVQWERFYKLIQVTATAAIGVKSPELVPDITQETAVKAANAIDRGLYRHRDEKGLTAWVWKIAKNELAMTMRARGQKVEKVSVPLDDEAERLATPSPEAEVLGNVVVQEAESLLAKHIKSPWLMKLFHMRYIDDLSTTQIAEELAAEGIIKTSRQISVDLYQIKVKLNLH